jgi:4-coumarate--CoA ligase (photoactive yellow protein activation family)
MITPPWWRDGRALARFVTDLVFREFARLRPDSRISAPASGGWSPEFALDHDLGADSLDLLSLSTSLVQALHLHRGGIEDYLLARRTLGGWIGVCQASLARFDHEITFRTSGSTGAAKPCHHRIEALEEEATCLAALLPGRSRVLSAVPAHHIYGFLFTVLLPRRLDREMPVEVLDIRDRAPALLGTLCRSGDLVIGHPDFWQAAVQASGRAVPNVVGVTSTAPCPAALAAAVTGSVTERLIEVYGASETAGIGWRSAPGAGFQLFPHWRRRGERLYRTTASGAVIEAELQDRLDWREDACFLPAGRLDGVIQVGGINVCPARIRKRLLDHPNVADAAVRPMALGEGNRLKAFIVPAPGAPDGAELRERIEAWIEDVLDVAERPRALNFGPALPVDGLGKLADWRAAIPEVTQ